MAKLGVRTDLLTDSPLGVAALTRGSVALELCLAMAIVLGPAAKRALLGAGQLFHGFIAVDMGLVSFYGAMAGALMLALVAGRPFPAVAATRHLLPGETRAIPVSRQPFDNPAGVDVDSRTLARQ
jgi:hypothetical protein